MRELLTRSGSVDPGILLRALTIGGLTVDELADAIAHRSGLLGVSGRSASVRALEQAANAGDERARLGLDMFVHRAAAGIASVATSLQRLDALVFTGGIGENSHRMRQAICGRLAALDVPMTAEPADDEDGILGIGPATSVLRVGAREDVVVARQVARRIGPFGPAEGDSADR